MTRNFIARCQNSPCSRKPLVLLTPFFCTKTDKRCVACIRPTCCAPKTGARAAAAQSTFTRPQKDRERRSGFQFPSTDYTFLPRQPRFRAFFPFFFGFISQDFFMGNARKTRHSRSRTLHVGRPFTDRSFFDAVSPRSEGLTTIHIEWLVDVHTMRLTGASLLDRSGVEA